MAEPACLLRLDKNCLLFIAQQLKCARSLAFLQCTAREMRELTAHNSCWLPLLCSSYGLELQDSPAVHAQRMWQDLHVSTGGAASAAAPSTSRAVAAPPRPRGYPLRFHALYTDGGMDDNNMVYWVDNMYMPNAWGAYCSEIAPNINTLAFLKGPDDAQDLAQREHRGFLISRLAVPALRLFGRSQMLRLGAVAGGFGSRRYEEMEHEMEATAGRALRNWSLLGLENFYMEMYQLLVAGVGFGGLLRDRLQGDLQSMDARLRAKYLEILAARQAGRSESTAASLLGFKHGATWQENGFRLVDRACLKDVQKRLAESLGMPRHRRAGGGGGGGTLGEGSAAASASTSGALPVAGVGPARPIRVGLVKRLSVSRAGDFTCPVRCGAIFIGSLPSTLTGAGSSMATAAAGPSGSEPMLDVASSSGSASWQQQLLARDWPAWDQLSGNGQNPEAPARDALAVEVVGGWTRQAGTNAVDSVGDVHELLERVRAGLLPRILQYRRLNNGEWIEFEAPEPTSSSSSSSVLPPPVPIPPAPPAPPLEPQPSATGLPPPPLASPGGAQAQQPQQQQQAPLRVPAPSQPPAASVAVPPSLAALAPRLAPVAWFRYFTREEVRQLQVPFETFIPPELRAPGFTTNAMFGEPSASAAAATGAAGGAVAPGGQQQQGDGSVVTTAAGPSGVVQEPLEGVAEAVDGQEEAEGAGAAAGGAEEGGVSMSVSEGEEEEGEEGGEQAGAMAGGEEVELPFGLGEGEDVEWGEGGEDGEGEEAEEGLPEMAALASEDEDWGDGGPQAHGAAFAEGGLYVHDSSSSMEEDEDEDVGTSEEEEEEENLMLEALVAAVPAAAAPPPPQQGPPAAAAAGGALMGAPPLQVVVGPAGGAPGVGGPPPGWQANPLALHEQAEAEAIMNLFHTVLQTVGAMCIRQMQRSVHDTASRLRTKWEAQSQRNVPLAWGAPPLAAPAAAPAAAAAGAGPSASPSVAQAQQQQGQQGQAAQQWRTNGGSHGAAPMRGTPPAGPRPGGGLFSQGQGEGTAAGGASAPSLLVLSEDPNYVDAAPELLMPLPEGVQGPAAGAAAVLGGDQSRTSRSLMHLDLEQARAGNMVSVKLIVPEDRMDDFGDTHDHVNVDCQFVALQGWVVELPPGVALRA